ncbi:protein serine/threonine phosphatase [Aureococcus anophagefferens]|nr:protein serine/threonine phosphatase [Aureococcus anophagefferens]
MGAAVSARADEVPGQQEKLAALYESLGVASLSEERRVEFEGQLRSSTSATAATSSSWRRTEAVGALQALRKGARASRAVLAGASEFRQKRLSYSAAPQRGKSGVLGDAASGERNRRPSLEFRSPEYDPANPAASPSPETRPLGAKARNAVTVKPGYEATTAPFDGSILGTYSYHGIEPKHYGAGVVSKINQDRGCVVAPYNDSDACSLYCIFDGHGEHGGIRVGLAMGRSIGDNAVKRIGVIAEPEVRTHEVSDRDDFLVMATDGVWEFIPNEEAIELRWRDIEGDYRDDITAIVMKLATQDPDAAL